MLTPFQRTLSSSIQCSGTGLHSGMQVGLALHPAPTGHGIVFVRTDVSDTDNKIPARYDLVTDTGYCTKLSNAAGVSVATVEHLLAALAGMGIDNARIELDAEEVPIMDGSSAPFLFLLECAGVKAQSAPRRYIELVQPLTVTQGDCTLTLHPYEGFALSLDIDFANDVVGHQSAEVDFSVSTFKNSLSRARTFGFEKDVRQLREMGLALGGSLDNAIVVGQNAVLNKDGLRYPDEFIRHKMLDCVGDLFLAGFPLLARVTGSRPGHGINNLLLHRLFEQPECWHFTTLERGSDVSSSVAAPKDISAVSSLPC